MIIFEANTLRFLREQNIRAKAKAKANAKTKFRFFPLFLSRAVWFAGSIRKRGFNLRERGETGRENINDINLQMNLIVVNLLLSFLFSLWQRRRRNWTEQIVMILFSARLMCDSFLKLHHHHHQSNYAAKIQRQMVVFLSKVVLLLLLLRVDQKEEGKGNGSKKCWK